MGVGFFENRNALDSLRNSEFDTYSAYGEVIDNSIQAEANTINLKFETTSTGQRKLIDLLAFGDDGLGMNSDVLASCLKLGWSSRFNDRSGIGRFGVGMVLGAIHECKRVEVYSKQKNDLNWLYTYIDLDEVEENIMTEIPTPSKKELPKKYSQLVGTESGTLILWTKYDKQIDGADKIISETHNYIGRTFRKFIWKDINILINGEEVKAHDPLFVTKYKTEFPDDIPAKEYEEFKFQWPIRDDTKLKEKFGDMGEITIRMSILPEEYRLTQGSGNSAFAKERKIASDIQEGISIMRENREVFCGRVPYWSSVKTGNSKQNTWKFEDKDRWWGCEISFGAELDNSFETKIIKRGAKPEPELLSAIKEMISGTRNTVSEEVSLVYKRSKAEKEAAEAEEAGNLSRHAGHGKSEIAAAKGTSSKKSKLDEEALNKTIKSFEEGTGSHLEASQKQRYIELFKKQPYTIVDDHKGWRGGTFWEVIDEGAHILLQYNLKHDFFVELRALEDLIAKETDLEKLKTHSDQFTGLVNLLLISFACTQSKFDKSQSLPVEEIIDDTNVQWGQMLKSYVKSWVREKGDNSDG